MKTLTVNDELYSDLEELAQAQGRSTSDLAAEAIESWIYDDELDEEELAEIEAAERDWQENGGMEAGEFFRQVRKEREEPEDSESKPTSFLDTARNMNLDGPPDWSARLDDDLHRESCDDTDRNQT